ncbi:MAG: flavin reductase family protein [Candidatus Lokiarchaeota archaeon]|nr:flavin reductase family protein [Candidatus Lokiarchaeota archaeon]
MKKINKVKTGWKLPPLPLPVCILGAHVNGKPNFNTIIWFNMLHDNPPLIGVAMSKKHYTNPGVKENRSFSINIPTSDMVVVTDYCGLHSGSKVDKAKEFELFYGDLGTAPMIEECSVNIECKLVNIKEFKNTDFLIGEIVEIYSDEKYVKNKEPDVNSFDSFICLMPHGPYRKIGDYLAEAYEVGTSYKPKK